MVPVLHIVRGSVTENLQYVAENFHTVAETLHTVPARVATVQRAVAQDMRALWEGAEANFHDVHAVDDSVPAEAEAPAQGRFEGWRLPLGWISLAAGAAVITGVGLPPDEGRERQQRPTPPPQQQKARGPAQQALPRTPSSLGR